jgi:uncharacterized protein (TIGR02145 family)
MFTFDSPPIKDSNTNFAGMKSITRLTLVGAAFWAFIIPLFLSCDKGNQPPVAVLKVLPSIGDTTLVFEFDAGGSGDDRNYALALQYRWDFDGNGTWDTEYSKYSAIAHPVKQPGYYSVAVEVKDLDGLCAVARDSIIVFGENHDIDTITDSRDGTQYRIVKVNGQWWMGENLKYGTIIPTDREQTDNDTVEMYRLTDDSRWDTVGGIYLWLEAKNFNVNDPRGICPVGWHLPTRQDWEGLLAPFPTLYSSKYFGKDGFSKLNLDLNNGGIRDGVLFSRNSMGTESNWDKGFWSSSYKIEEQDYLPFFCSFTSKDNDVACGFWSRSNTGLLRYHSVRCVKDN